MMGDGVFQPNGLTRDHFTDYFSNLGLGWRFNRNFLAEYIFSTDFGQTSPRHTLLLRYTFSRGESVFQVAGCSTDRSAPTAAF